MDPKTVEKLEGKIEEAIADIIVKMGVRKLPLLPSRHTMHLMAKAAVPSTRQPSRTMIVATLRATARGLIASPSNSHSLARSTSRRSAAERRSHSVVPSR